MKIVPSPLLFERLREAIRTQEQEYAALPAELDPDDEPFVRTLREIARILQDSALTLRPAKGLAEIGLSRAGRAITDPRSMADDPMLRPYLEILTAKWGLHQTEGAVKRLSRLLAYLVCGSLTAKVDAYLDHVAKLYVWGFETEAIVMCRAVLDAALASRLSAEAERRPAGSGSRELRLDEAIEECHKLGLIGPDERDLAHRLRRDGNELLHVAPTHHLEFPDALAAIEALGRVLQRLFPHAATGLP